MVEVELELKLELEIVFEDELSLTTRLTFDGIVDELVINADMPIEDNSATDVLEFEETETADEILREVEVELIVVRKELVVVLRELVVLFSASTKFELLLETGLVVGFDDLTSTS